MDIDTLHRTLQLAKERRLHEKWRFFVPVPKQEEFMAAGATCFERMLMAGNGNGKCISYNTLVPHPDGSSTMAGELFDEPRPFSVMAWDGCRAVSAKVSAVVRKLPEPMVRLWFRSGDYVEAALDHRMMDRDGQWQFVRRLLAKLPYLPPSSSELGQSVPSVDAQRSMQIAGGFPADYLWDFHLDDGQLLAGRVVALSSPPSPIGAPPRIYSECDWDGLENTHTSTRRSGCGPRSSRDDDRRCEALCVGCRDRVSCTGVQPTKGLCRELPPLPPGLVFASRSDRADALRGFGAGLPLADPFMEGNRLIAYEAIPCQAVYDFTVPRYHNYIAAGAIHHNTETAAYEISRHMCGEYPDWWQGRRFDKPTRVWAAGTSLKEISDAAQTKLLGPPGNKELFGTGMIPKEAITNVRPARGYPDAVDSFQVKCKINGKLDESALSRYVVKQYSQEREDWQGADIDILWADEEPPMKLYTEGLARLRGRGFALLTMTPLMGMTALVTQFMEQPSADRRLVRMGIKDTNWYTPDQVRLQIASYPIQEREARINGDPLMGSGKVFRVMQQDLMIPPIPFNRIPLDWAKIWGVDFGGNSDTSHPFAAVLYALDRETSAKPQYGLPHLDTGPVGTVYIIHAIRMTNSTVLQHADAMKRIAADVPVAWPHDGHEKDRNSGEALAEQYKKHGLKMHPSHATHPSGGFSTYAGVQDMDTHMQARQWKVFDTLTDWLGEYAQYHYKDGNILVKVKDDLMSATRIAHMMRRYARPVALGARSSGNTRPTTRGQLNPWTGRVDHHEGTQTWR